MVFKYVDPNQPDKEFKVILDVIEPNNEWKCKSHMHAMPLVGH